MQSTKQVSTKLLTNNSSIFKPQQTQNQRLSNNDSIKVNDLIKS